jgi:hypothetical protein
MPSIEYVGTWGETGERFQLIAESGTKPVMEILVDTADSDRIYVAPVCPRDLPVPGVLTLSTNGKAHRHEVTQISDDFIDGMMAAVALSPGGVCLSSLYGYVMPRIATFMGRCYVADIAPKTKTDS